jgi:peptidyl-tRNA hydrolase
MVKFASRPLDKGRIYKDMRVCKFRVRAFDIYDKAKELNIPCALIQDAGLTEFNGVPTYTCCAIGPDDQVNIDKVTGELPLL